MSLDEIFQENENVYKTRKLCAYCGMACDVKASMSPLIVSKNCVCVFHKGCLIDENCPRCKMAILPISVNNRRCIFSGCFKTTQNDNWICTDCIDRYWHRFYNIVVLGGCSGIEWSSIPKKMTSVVGIQSWISMLSPTHYVFSAIVHNNLLQLKTKWQYIHTMDKLYTTNHALLRDVLKNQQDICIDEKIGGLSAYKQISVVNGTPTKKEICYEFRLFCRKLSIKESPPINWLPNGNIKPVTHLDIYDHNSLYRKILRRGIAGIKLTDIYAEYDNAHIDLIRLRDSGKVWITEDYYAVFAGEYLNPPIEGLVEFWMTTDTM